MQIVVGREIRAENSDAIVADGSSGKEVFPVNNVVITYFAEHISFCRL